MWIVLPTKDCKCATCEKLRETVTEDGTLRMGEHAANVKERLGPGICPECAGTYAHIGNCSRLM